MQPPHDWISPDTPRAAPSPAPDDRELPEILAAIRRHEARRSNTSDAAWRVPEAEVGAFLGPRAAARLLAGVLPDGRNLLAEVQPVLSLFLGRRAAGRLATRLVESSFVRS